MLRFWGLTLLEFGSADGARFVAARESQVRDKCFQRRTMRHVRVQADVHGNLISVDVDIDEYVQRMRLRDPG